METPYRCDPSDVQRYKSTRSVALITPLGDNPAMGGLIDTLRDGTGRIRTAVSFAFSDPAWAIRYLTLVAVLLIPLLGYVAMLGWQARAYDLYEIQESTNLTSWTRTGFWMPTNAPLTTRTNYLAAPITAAFPDAGAYSRRFEPHRDPD